jgi:hypothetical protein
MTFASAAILTADDKPADKPPERGRSAFGIEGHQLGDQTLALAAGLAFPLFFQEYGGQIHDTNLTLGGSGELQYSAYLNSNVRLGADLAGLFARSPNDRTLFLLPITVRIAYVLAISRFEFPISLGAGINIVNYREWSAVDFILKPGVAGFWRYDSNWSFGLNVSWWLDFQGTTKEQAADQARMADYLIVTPAVFYNF